MTEKEMLRIIPNTTLVLIFFMPRPKSSTTRVNQEYGVLLLVILLLLLMIEFQYIHVLFKFFWECGLTKA